MATKNIFLTMLLASSLLLMGCPKECISTTNSYSKTLSFFPKDSVIKVGDTLWLSGKFSCDSIFNEATQKVDSYCDALIGSTLGITALQTEVTPAVDSFTYIESKGKCFSVADANPKTIKQLSFLYNNKTYEIRIGIVANKKGRYAVGVGNGLFTNKKDAPECQKASLNLKPENFDTHIYMLRDFLYPKPVADLDIEHGYCFIVK